MINNPRIFEQSRGFATFLRGNPGKIRMYELCMQSKHAGRRKIAGIHAGKNLNVHKMQC